MIQSNLIITEWYTVPALPIFCKFIIKENKSDDFLGSD